MKMRYFVFQVKLAYQESELLTLLKKIPLGQSELNILREKAEQLRDGKLQSRGEALLPLTLASFIFDLFCMPGKLYFTQFDLCDLQKVFELTKDNIVTYPVKTVSSKRHSSFYCFPFSFQ